MWNRDEKDRIQRLHIHPGQVQPIMVSPYPSNGNVSPFAHQNMSPYSPQQTMSPYQNYHQQQYHPQYQNPHFQQQQYQQQQYHFQQQDVLQQPDFTNEKIHGSESAPPYTDSK